jgi:histidinol-phosphate aminotransferase
MVAAANEPATRLMVLCNPHNPTGTFVSSDELAQMIQAIPADVLVLIDEAYCEFADAPEFPQPVPELIRRTNVLVTRTFSKAYGLAGARVGYGLGHPGLIARLRASQPPFQLSSVAQAGALAWLERPADVLARTAKVRTERARLSRELARRGFRVVPSQANFVFVIGAERPWASELLVRGVEVRQFQDGFRVTIGSNADHGRLLAAIDEIADGDGHL